MLVPATATNYNMVNVNLDRLLENSKNCVATFDWNLYCNLLVFLSDDSINL